MITENLQKQINEAMKSKDSVRVSTLRMLSSELHNAKIAKREELTNEEELAVVKKEAKKRRDAIESYRSAGAEERAKQEEAELEILQEFLPEEMSDEEIEKIVDEVIVEMRVSGMQNIGQVIGASMKRVEGGASGERVAGVVKSRLTAA